MLPHYSEFSYGFALTNEIVGLVSLKAAPIFPSLIEEGKKGGGYDVKLDMPGLPLFLQFKRSEKMMRKSAREYKLVKNSAAFSTHGGLDIPFFRFPITDSEKSQQHKMLCDLDDGSNLVFYAAPSFYEIHELNEAWDSKSIIRRSVFIKPNDIGNITRGNHTVSWDSINNAWLCSEPEQISSWSSSTIIGEIQEKLSVRDKLRSELIHLDKKLNLIESRLQDGYYIDERRPDDENEIISFEKASVAINQEDEEKTFEGGPIPIKEAEVFESKDESNILLQTLADRSARLFGSQLVIIQ